MPLLICLRNTVLCPQAGLIPLLIPLMLLNSLNRAALLWNVHILWTHCSCLNTWGSASLIVRGSDKFLFSREGVTLGIYCRCFCMLIVLFDSSSP